MGQIRTECAARGQSVPEARVGKSIGVSTYEKLIRQPSQALLALPILL